MVSSSAALNGNDLHQALMENAQTPEPAAGPQAPTDMISVFSNFEWVEVDGKKVRRGLPIGAITEDMNAFTTGWPRRVGNDLFVKGQDHQPRFLDSTAQLFAYLDAKAHLDWGRNSDMVSQDRYLAHLQETVKGYDALERFPHRPRMRKTYYMHPRLPASTGEHLEEFVHFFSPHTAVDRELIKAFVACLLWGGPPGARPAWLVTASADAPEGGRGVGKSKCVELCGELVGGMLDISPKEDIVAIKKRLLSPGARTLRLARIDNIKTLRFSWADLEGLITSPVISGHRMYKGEGRRPNTITWALTLNGASLSRDMAKRVIIVKLDVPEYSPTWEQGVRDYIEEHRWHILSDVCAFLGKQENGHETT
jgi:hypothetical protein